MAVSLAVLGAVLGLASLLGEWSRVVLDDDTTAPAWSLFSHGLFGMSYTLALIAMLAIVAVSLFSRYRGTSRGLRVAGLFLATLLLTLLAATAFVLDNYPYRVSGGSFDLSLILGRGIYAAFGAWLALGAALLLSYPAQPRRRVTDETQVE